MKTFFSGPLLSLDDDGNPNPPPEKCVNVYSSAADQILLSSAEWGESGPPGQSPMLSDPDDIAQSLITAVKNDHISSDNGDILEKVLAGNNADSEAREVLDGMCRAIDKTLEEINVTYY